MHLNFLDSSELLWSPSSTVGDVRWPLKMSTAELRRELLSKSPQFGSQLATWDYRDRTRNLNVEIASTYVVRPGRAGLAPADYGNADFVVLPRFLRNPSLFLKKLGGSPRGLRSVVRLL